MKPDPCTIAMPPLEVVGTAGADQKVACYFPTLYSPAGAQPRRAPDARFSAMTDTSRGALVSTFLGVVLVAAVALSAGCGGGSASRPTASASPGPVSSSPSAAVVAARVKRRHRDQSEVEHTIDFSRLSSKALTYRQALEATLRSHLLSQEAARLGVVISRRRRRSAPRTGGRPAWAALRRSSNRWRGVGLSLDDYRQELRAGLLAEKLGARKFPAAVAGRQQALAF